MTEDRRSTRDTISDGIRQGIGVLSALKDAIEETINEARERGDLSQDRVKEAMKRGLEKAQEKAEVARERLDFVNQKDFDSLVKAVEELEVRVSRLEGGNASSGPDSADV